MIIIKIMKNEILFLHSFMSDQNVSPLTNLQCMNTSFTNAQKYMNFYFLCEKRKQATFLSIFTSLLAYGQHCTLILQILTNVKPNPLKKKKKKKGKDQVTSGATIHYTHCDKAHSSAEAPSSITVI